MGLALNCTISVCESQQLHLTKPKEHHGVLNIVKDCSCLQFTRTAASTDEPSSAPWLTPGEEIGLHREPSSWGTNVRTRCYREALVSTLLKRIPSYNLHQNNFCYSDVTRWSSLILFFVIVCGTCDHLVTYIHSARCIDDPYLSIQHLALKKNNVNGNLSKKQSTLTLHNK